MNERLKPQPEQAPQLGKKRRAIYAHAKYEGGMRKANEILLSSQTLSQDERTSILAIAGFMIYPKERRLIMRDYMLTSDSIKKHLELIAQNTRLKNVFLSTLAELDKIGTIRISSDSRLGKSVKNSRQGQNTKPQSSKKPQELAKVADTPQMQLTEKTGSDLPQIIYHPPELPINRTNRREALTRLLEEHADRYDNLPISLGQLGQLLGGTKQRIAQYVKEEQVKKALEQRGVSLIKTKGMKKWRVTKIDHQDPKVSD